MTHALMRPSYGRRPHHPLNPAFDLPQTSGWTAQQVQTAKEICAIDARWRAIGVGVPSLLHVAVCMQESSLDPQAIGDNGQSYGIHQIYQVAWPNTWQVALDPYADYAYHIMAKRWHDVFLAMGGDGAWADVSGRPAFVQTAAPRMQGSIQWPAGLGALRYGEAVSVLEYAS